LYLNNGDGTFRDATASSGLAGPASGWSCGAAFLDFDNDGRLDLYVSHYGAWPMDVPRPYCGDKARNLRKICSPTLVAPQRHVLYRNCGDGTFEDVTAKAGVGRRKGRGMGVIAADLDRDGRIDLLVANDMGPNCLYLNRGDGTFEDATDVSGAAGNEAGAYMGNMGLDAQDLDGDGLPELVVSTFRGDGAALYRNVGAGSFIYISDSAGIIPDTHPYVGWGLALEDFDNDGRPDLLMVNGHVDDNLKLFDQDIPQPEPAKVWWNRGKIGSRIILEPVADPGPFFAVPHVARGAAFGDLDNDGDIDVVISRMDALPAILINESPPRSWIRLELIGRRSNRSAIGAAIEIRAGGRVFHRQVKGGASYLSANDPRVLVGLGDIERVESVTVQWPSGARSVVSNLAPRQSHVIQEPGQGGTAFQAVKQHAQDAKASGTAFQAVEQHHGQDARATSERGTAFQAVEQHHGQDARATSERGAAFQAVKQHHGQDARTTSERGTAYQAVEQHHGQDARTTSERGTTFQAVKRRAQDADASSMHGTPAASGPR
jgi:hypothetical protein